MKMASGRTSRMACIARTLALTMRLSAVTKGGAALSRARAPASVRGCRPKSAVAAFLLVPPAVGRGKGGADEHLVYRRVKLHPRVAPREVTRINRKVFGKVRVL